MKKQKYQYATKDDAAAWASRIATLTILIILAMMQSAFMFYILVQK